MEEPTMKIVCSAMTTAALCCVALVGQAWAQSRAAANPAVQKPEASKESQSAALQIDPAKRAEILKLQELTGTKTRVVQVMGEMEKSIKPLMTGALPPGEYRDKLIQLFFEKFHSKFDAQAILDTAVPIYDKYLSHEEIKAMIAFYQTPAGQKSVTVMPQMLAEMMEASKKQGERIGRESMLEALDEHPELKKALEDTQRNPPPQ